MFSILTNSEGDIKVAAPFLKMAPVGSTVGPADRRESERRISSVQTFVRQGRPVFELFLLVQKIVISMSVNMNNVPTAIFSPLHQ